jgi:RNA recognition motif-containing protein
VEFQAPSQAQAALKLNQNIFRNHKISIKFCDPDIVLELPDLENSGKEKDESTTSSYNDAAEDESTAVSSNKEDCDKYHSVIVYPLPETASHRELCQFFEEGLKRSRGITLKVSKCYIPIKKKSEEWARAEKEGWARVHFKDRSHVQYALTLNGSTFQQTRISVKPWISHTEDQRGGGGGSANIGYDAEQQDVNRWIYVGNLPKTTYSRELSDFILGRLEKTRGIKPVLLECKVRNGNKFAFVQFEDPAHALYALKLHGNTFRDNKITVQPRKMSPGIVGQEEDDSAIELATEENKSGNEQLGAQLLQKAEYGPPSKEFSSDVSLSSIYVENVPDSVDSHFLSALIEKELRKVFEVTETDILHCCIRKQEKDAFIEFKTKEQANWARGLRWIVLNKEVLTIGGWHPGVVPDIYKKRKGCDDGSKSSHSQSSKQNCVPQEDTNKYSTEIKIAGEIRTFSKANDQRTYRDEQAASMKLAPLRLDNQQHQTRVQSDPIPQTEPAPSQENQTLKSTVQFRVQDGLASMELATLRHENQQLKERIESDTYLQTELARIQQGKQLYERRIESEAQIRVQRDLAACELTILRRENEQLKERAQSDICLHTELSHLRRKVQQLKGSETQSMDDISALRHENQQLKRKHYIDASDKLELVDLRRKEEQLKLDRTAKSQDMKRMKRSFDFLQQQSAELRSKLSEETRKESNVELLEDSKREANSLRDEMEKIKANHAIQEGVTKREANALRDEIYQIKANHPMQAGFIEVSTATSAVNENLQSDLDSAKETIQNLETQMEGMRSYFQAAATVFEAPRDEEGIQRRQQEQPNDEGATTIVKTELRDGNEP